MNSQKQVVKCLSKGELKEANRRAKQSAGRWIDPEYVERLPDDLRYPVFFTLPWERQGWVRCQIGTAATAEAEDYDPVWLDVPRFMYDNLGEIEVPADNPDRELDAGQIECAEASVA